MKTDATVLRYKCAIPALKPYYDALNSVLMELEAGKATMEEVIEYIEALEALSEKNQQHEEAHEAFRALLKSIRE